MVLRGLHWLDVSEYIAAGIVSVIALIDLYGSGWPFWTALGLLPILVILMACWPRRPYRLYYVAARAVLVIGLGMLDFYFLFLGFGFSAVVMFLFPNHWGALWILLLALSSGAVLWRFDLGWPGVLVVLMMGSGYAGFGLMAYSRVRAREAQDRAESLLADLQEAHRQLQEYAERAEELAVAEERNRLAREMHDTLGHRLTVAAVQLEGAQRLIPNDPERATQMVGTVRDQVREALAELRRTVATLRTMQEANLSLPQALARLVVSFENATGLRVHVALPEEMPAVPDTHRLALYRVAQEALTNVQRHAHAGEVWLELAWREGTVFLQISDNGVGIAAGAGEAGFGLRGLRERAEQLGGQLALEPRPGGGTQLIFRLPLPTEEDNG